MSDPRRLTSDPICGAAVDKLRAPAVAVYRGRVVYFCSVACKTKFFDRQRGEAPRAAVRGVSPRMLISRRGAHRRESDATGAAARSLSASPVAEVEAVASAAIVQAPHLPPGVEELIHPPAGVEPVHREVVGRDRGRTRGGRRSRRRGRVAGLTPVEITLEAIPPPIEHALLVGPLVAGAFASAAPGSAAAGGGSDVPEARAGASAAPGSAAAGGGSDVPEARAGAGAAAGAGAVMATGAPTIHHLIFEVGGMTCPTCALRVERAIRRSPRVITASVNLALDLALVEVGALSVSEEEQLLQGITREIQRSGYSVAPRRMTAERRHPPMIYRWLLPRFGLAAVILAVQMAMAVRQPYGRVNALLGLVALLVCGLPLLADSLKRARYLSFNSSTITALAALGAYFLALRQTVVGDGLSHPAPLFEGATAIITVTLLAQLLQRRAVDHLLAELPLPLRRIACFLPKLLDAQTTKGHRQRQIYALVGVSLPLLLVLALAVLGLRLAAGQGALAATLPALTMVVAFSPHALVYSLTLATLLGLRRAAELAIIFRDEEALERLARTTVIVSTKTVVMQGTPQVARFEVLEGDPAELLALVAACEAGSRQAVGQALYTFAVERRPKPVGLESLSIIPGHGIIACSRGRRVLIGSRSLMAREGVSLPEDGSGAAGGSMAFMALEGRLSATFLLEDRIRPGMAQIVTRLRHRGMQVFLLTGDEVAVARGLARAAGMDDALAGLPTEHRLRELGDARGSDQVMAVVGDSTRDGPIGEAGEVSVVISESALCAPFGVWLARGTFADLVPALDLARRTWRVAHQALLFSLAEGLALFLAGALGLLGFHGPLIAGGASALVFSVLVESTGRRLGQRPPR